MVWPPERATTSTGLNPLVASESRITVALLVGAGRFANVASLVANVSEKAASAYHKSKNEAKQCKLVDQILAGGTECCCKTQCTQYLNLAELMNITRCTVRADLCFVSRIGMLEHD